MDVTALTRRLFRTCGQSRSSALTQFSTAKCLGHMLCWTPKSSAGVMKLPTRTQKKGERRIAVTITTATVIHQRPEIANEVIGGTSWSRWSVLRFGDGACQVTDRRIQTSISPAPRLHQA